MCDSPFQYPCVVIVNNEQVLNKIIKHTTVCSGVFSSGKECSYQKYCACYDNWCKDKTQKALRPQEPPFGITPCCWFLRKRRNIKLK